MTPSTKPSKRSSPESYRAYHREYMRRYRKKNGADKLIRAKHENTHGKKTPSHRDETIQFLRQRRIALGYGQKELAPIVGVSATSIGVYENMRVDPGFSKFKAWVGALGGKIIVEWEEF